MSNAPSRTLGYECDLTGDEPTRPNDRQAVVAGLPLDRTDEVPYLPTYLLPRYPAGSHQNPLAQRACLHSSSTPNSPKRKHERRQPKVRPPSRLLGRRRSRSRPFRGSGGPTASMVSPLDGRDGACPTDSRTTSNTRNAHALISQNRACPAGGRGALTTRGWPRAVSSGGPDKFRQGCSPSDDDRRDENLGKASEGGGRGKGRGGRGEGLTIVQYRILGAGITRDPLVMRAGTACASPSCCPTHPFGSLSGSLFGLALSAMPLETQNGLVRPPAPILESNSPSSTFPETAVLGAEPQARNTFPLSQSAGHLPFDLHHPARLKPATTDISAPAIGGLMALA
jgi:hypothetical protein